jgi:hypothetical protein
VVSTQSTTRYQTHIFFFFFFFWKLRRVFDREVSGVYMYTTPAPSHTTIRPRYQKVTCLVSVVLVVAEMEVVVLGVTNTDEEDNQVNDGLASRVLAEVLGLVSAEETLSLDLGGGTSGELLVEADDTLHADSIRSGANGLS